MNEYTGSLPQHAHLFPLLAPLFYLYPHLFTSTSGLDDP